IGFHCLFERKSLIGAILTAFGNIDNRFNMLLNRTFGFILIAAIALVLSYSFNFFILHMSERAVIVQVLMVFLFACALGTIFFFSWFAGITIRWKPDVFRVDLHAIRDNLPVILLAIAF